MKVSSTHTLPGWLSPAFLVSKFVTLFSGETITPRGRHLRAWRTERRAAAIRMSAAVIRPVPAPAGPSPFRRS